MCRYHNKMQRVATVVDLMGEASAKVRVLGVCAGLAWLVEPP